MQVMQPPPPPPITLKWGDKITVAINRQTRGVFVVTGTVHTVFPLRAAFFAQLKEDGKIAHNAYFNIDNEGVTWVKGHHDAGSPEMQELLGKAQEHYHALEVAAALSK